MSKRRFAFTDPAGGSGSDSFPLAIANCSIFGRAVLDGYWEKRPPFSPDDAVREFAEILTSYRITTVTGDRYAGSWPSDRFREHGITYVPSERTKSEIFLEFLALVNSGRVKIPSNRRLRAQLVGLERRTSRAGKDTVDHPPGAHDDVANCVAGALVLAAAAPLHRKLFLPEVLDIRIGVPPPPPEPGTWIDPQAGKYLNDPFLDLPRERWTKVN